MPTKETIANANLYEEVKKETAKFVVQIKRT
jgi:hypothetical protein